MAGKRMRDFEDTPVDHRAASSASLGMRNALDAIVVPRAQEKILELLLDSLFCTPKRVDELMSTWLCERHHARNIWVRMLSFADSFFSADISFKITSDKRIEFLCNPLFVIHFSELAFKERQLVALILKNWSTFFETRTEHMTGTREKYLVYQGCKHTALIRSKIDTARMCARMFAVFLYRARSSDFEGPAERAPVPRRFYDALVLLKAVYSKHISADRKEGCIKKVLCEGALAIVDGWNPWTGDFLPPNYYAPLAEADGKK